MNKIGNLCCSVTCEKYKAELFYFFGDLNEIIFRLIISQIRKGNGYSDFGRRHTIIYFIDFKIIDLNSIITNIEEILYKHGFPRRLIEYFVQCFMTNYLKIYE